MTSDDELSNWPRNLMEIRSVLDWITNVLPGHPAVSGPSRIFQSNTWSVVAQFDASYTKDVERLVFKASHLSLFVHGPTVDSLLGRICPQNVPEIITYETWTDRAWCLYRPFSARVISSMADGGPMEGIARTFAEIQSLVSQQPPSKLAMIPHVALDQLPERFEVLRKESQDFECPTALDNLPSLISKWTDEMVGMEWPDSIDHVDLHRDNAAQRDDGSVLIFDWEESVVGCPFFSIDRLLWDAEEFGRTDQVLQAYLELIPWGSLNDRRRAFDLARCLSPIQREVERANFRKAQGWQRINHWDKLKPNLPIWNATQ